jgi:WD40 repeat protein
MEHLSNPGQTLGPENIRHLRERSHLGRGRTNQVLWSPDGNHLLVLSAVGFWLYDATDLSAAPRCLTGSDGWARCAAFSPNGRMVAGVLGHTPHPTAVDQMTTIIHLWDTTSGESLGSLEGHTGQISRLAFSPDGRLLISTSADQTTRLWEVQQRTLLDTLPYFAWTMAFDAPRNLMASIGVDGMVRLTDLHNGQEQAAVKAHVSLAACDLTFGPHGMVLATSDRRTSRVRVHNIETEVEQILMAYSDGPWANRVAFNRAGTLLAIACVDGTIRLHDAATGITQSHMRGHHEPLENLLFSPDGELLASISSRAIRIWKVSHGTAKTILLSEHPFSQGNIAFSPDSKRLADADGTVRVWNIGTGALEKAFFEHADIIHDNCSHFHPDGTQIASGHMNGVLLLWDMETGQPRTLHPRQRISIKSLAFSPDGRLIAIGGDAGTVNLWDIRSGRQRLMLSSDNDTRNAVSGVDFDPSSVILASGEREHNVHLWNVESGDTLRVLQAFAVDNVLYNPSGELLAASGSLLLSPDHESGIVRLWQTNEYEWLTDHYYGTFTPQIAFSPDKRLLAIASTRSQPDSRNREISLLLVDVQTEDEEILLSNRLLRHSVTCHLAFSPDGGLLALSTANDLIFWDVARREIVLELNCPAADPIMALCFSPDGRWLALGSGNGTLRLLGVD